MPGPRSASGATPAAAPAGDAPAFDWLVALASGWFVVGMFVDAWAHHHGLPESFWTPWHGLLYSGFFATAAVLLGGAWRRRGAGRAWWRALPAGYGAALAGAAVFFFGGLGDMVWHTVFGIEVDIDALFSPSHLTLGVGALLMAAGPFRAAWRRPGGLSPRAADWLPAGLSLAYIFAILSFFTQAWHPLSQVYATRPPTGDGADELTRSLGAIGIVLQGALLGGVLLYALRRFRLPPGLLTLMIGAVGCGTAVMEDQYRFFPLAIGAGLFAEALYRVLDPSPDRPWPLRLFAFLVPAVFYWAYLVQLLLTDGLSWTIHLWTGSAFMAGCASLLLSFLIAGPGGSVRADAAPAPAPGGGA